MDECKYMTEPTFKQLVKAFEEKGLLIDCYKGDAGIWCATIQRSGVARLSGRGYGSTPKSALWSAVIDAIVKSERSD